MFYFQKGNLLSSKEFLHECVLPYLDISTLITKSHKSVISLPVSLKLFQITMETDKLHADWLLECQPLPIVLCLCEIIHFCGASWECYEMTGEFSLVDIKEMAVSILDKVVALLVRNKHLLSG